MEIQHLLQKTGLFKLLVPEQINQLISSIQTVTFEAQESIIREGEIADVLYIIGEGTCEVFKQGENGREIILARMEDGAYFGEQAILAEAPEKRSASVRAVNKTKLYTVSHEKFQAILASDKKLKKTLKHISNYLKERNSQLSTNQDVAWYGIWEVDLNTKIMHWSKELYELYELDPNTPAPELSEYLALVHPDDALVFNSKFMDATHQYVEFECEIRMSKFDNREKYYWYYIQCKTTKDIFGQVVKLTYFTLDITKRKITELEQQKNQQQLISTARRVGMADVATSILHNVGNILNSANISVSTIGREIKKSHVEKLKTLCDMMETNKDDLFNYLSNDEKGKVIPEYIIALSKIMLNSQNVLKQEIHQISRQLEYIKDISNLQSSLGGPSNVLEQVVVCEVIESAALICMQSSENNMIKLEQNCPIDISLVTDKLKLLQIIINLIQNAKESLYLVTDDSEKYIKINAGHTSPGFIEIRIEDNGIGIAPENLANIFQFGFTTKEKGHGFGLHSSALAAQEMNGRLDVMSDGVNKGAQFVLTIPITSPTEINESNRENNILN